MGEGGALQYHRHGSTIPSTAPLADQNILSWIPSERHGIARDKSLRDGIDVEREKLLTEIAQDYRDTARWTGKPEMSAAVRRAILKVPREAFLPQETDGAAYANRPLPIGFGQTISQPYIVAIMTE